MEITAGRCVGGCNTKVLPDNALCTQCLGMLSRNHHDTIKLIRNTHRRYRAEPGNVAARSAYATAVEHGLKMLDQEREARRVA